MIFLFKIPETRDILCYFFRDNVQATSYKVAVDETRNYNSYIEVSYLDRKYGWISLFKNNMEIPSDEDVRYKLFLSLLYDARRLVV